MPSHFSSIMEHQKSHEDTHFAWHYNTPYLNLCSSKFHLSFQDKFLDMKSLCDLAFNFSFQDPLNPNLQHHHRTWNLTTCLSFLTKNVKSVRFKEQVDWKISHAWCKIDKPKPLTLSSMSLTSYILFPVSSSDFDVFSPFDNHYRIFSRNLL